VTTKNGATPPTCRELLAMARAGVPKAIERMRQLVADETAPVNVRADAARLLARFADAAASKGRVLH